MYVPTLPIGRTAAFALGLAAFLPGYAQTLAAATPSSTPTVVTTDPRAPRPAGVPCVVQLMDNQPFSGEGEYSTDNHFTYMPPAACPRPWAKVVLETDISSSRHTVVDDIGISLAGIPLLHQAAPRYDAPARWHAERDLTDYSALLAGPHTGSYWTTEGFEARDPNGQTSAFTGSARLLFYPPTAQTPAPAVPDAVFRLDGGTPRYLPHNIVRAYVDVENAQPWWYFCVPGAEADRHQLMDVFAPGDTVKISIFPYDEGCIGSSFREIRVDVDGTAAGVAPVFPLLPADPSINYLHNPLNLPTPTPQMLGYVPYRIDLSPFAGQLDAAGPHLVAVPGVLLVYLDRNRALVTGGVTMNTLAGSPAEPTYTSTLLDGDETLRGDIVTKQSRDFEIRGFVNTSRGRIDLSVKQSSAFENTQSFDIRGPYRPYLTTADKLYEQAVLLRSTTDRISRRAIGPTLLGKDIEHVSYPLAYYYHMATTVEDYGDGWGVALRNGTVAAIQRWVQDADHYRRGRAHYTTHLGESFAGSRTHAYDNWDPWLRSPSADSHWQSVSSHRFTDNFGSCFQAAVGARNGMVDATSRGVGCPGDHNHVRWFAHPDGSPNSLGWWR